MTRRLSWSAIVRSKSCCAAGYWSVLWRAEYLVVQPGALVAAALSFAGFFYSLFMLLPFEYSIAPKSTP